ncbi:MAG: TniQ family protein, partial [Sideroxyarcus sp.]|nr:TniQ family protein [Sideroxyarcus sp.]
FGPFSNMRVSEFPVNMDVFVAAAMAQFGDAQAVISNTTLVPYFDRVGGHPWHSGSSQSPVATAGYGLSMLSNGNLRTWRACAHCILDDKQRNPYCYWRRAHQLPTAFLCLEHRTLLNACWVPPKQLHIQFYLPDEMALVDTFECVEPETNMEMLTSLSKFSVDVLRDDGKLIASATVNATIAGALRNLNMITASGRICRQTFVPEFARRFGFLRHHAALAKSVSAASIEILCRSLDKPNAWRQGAQNVMLLTWLFGTWGTFKDRCKSIGFPR